MERRCYQSRILAANVRYCHLVWQSIAQHTHTHALVIPFQIIRRALSPTACVRGEPQSIVSSPLIVDFKSLATTLGL
jgi:hypothetical protein